ncbi:MAG: amino acid racemase [Desulfobacteraceae bacterium]|nr:amino acid racemase [Desulfobacteraceae bacterium]
MNEKTVGILGGMGPEATIDLMTRIVKATPAVDDIDHIHVVVDNDPKVPSRIRALIERTGESPLPHLQRMALKLAHWGVDFLAIPCNTAHYYHEGIQRVVNIPVLNMVDLTVEAMVARNPGLKTVGILASIAVLDLKLYEKRFSENSIELLRPSDDFQAGVMGAIRKIKTGHYGAETVSVVQSAADHLVKRGAGALLIACTELSVIGRAIETPVPCYDSAQVLAEAIVRTARGETVPPEEEADEGMA